MREGAYPGAAKAWWLIAILFLASIVSVIDRGILNIVVDPVKTDLALSDVQISLLQGLAFGLFYAAVGIPLGLVADRASRRWLIIGGVATWSAATIAGGMAQSFGALFTSRILVGLGEAALAPSAISLIADLFPPDRRGRPISVFLTGQAIASGLSVSVTSFIVAAVPRGDFANVPLLNQLAPWRVAFICCGFAGFLVVAAMLTTREPERRHVRAISGLLQQIGENLRFLSDHAAILGPLYLGFALCFLAVYGAGAWVPTMLVRGFGASSMQIGKWLGPISMAFGVLGPTLGGTLVDRAARHGAGRAKFRILVIAPLCVIPSALAAFAPSLLSAIFLAASSGAVVAVIGTTMFATLQSILPSNMHGLSVALTGLLNTVLGATTGPLLVALCTEHLYRNPTMVGTSIATVVIPALLLGSALFALASRLAAKNADGSRPRTTVKPSGLGAAR